MFRDTAYLMNIAKWAYIILVAKAHRNIRREDHLDRNFSTVSTQQDQKEDNIVDTTPDNRQDSKELKSDKIIKEL